MLDEKALVNSNVFVVAGSGGGSAVRGIGGVFDCQR